MNRINAVAAILVVLIGVGVAAGVYYFHPTAVPVVSDGIHVDQPSDQDGSTSSNDDGSTDQPATTTTPTPGAPNPQDAIQVITPTPGAVISSPLVVEGKALGRWYFEASFPVRLLDGNGRELIAIPAQAQSDWMVEGYVPFKATLNFTLPSTATGTLILHNDNPSGMPERDEEVRIPVTFPQRQKTVSLYFYDQLRDRGPSGAIMCSIKGLVPVERTIPVSTTPLQDAIRLLLQSSVTDDEKKMGLTTEYPLPGVELKGASMHGNELTVELTDPQNKTSGGSCRVGILKAQIEATAKQFPEVKSVKIIPETLFQP
jgi:hypothetical protein